MTDTKNSTWPGVRSGNGQDRILSIRHLSVRYALANGFLGFGKKELSAVCDIDLDIHRGETIGIVGESGCGKSTLARALMGLVPISDGAVQYRPDGNGGNGKEIDLSRCKSRKDWARVHRQIQMVFQDPFSSLSPKQHIGKIIAEPLIVHGFSQAQWQERVTELLTLVGLSGSDFRRYPHEFSGGQRQRIMIARALALSPRMLIADEAVSALDVSIQLQIIKLLDSLKRELGLTLIFISHDLSVVNAISDRVAVMYLGRIVEVGPADVVFRRSRHPYARMLVRSTPIPDPDRKIVDVEITGELPSPISPPSGCSFHPRCPFAQDICARKKPALIALEDGHFSACHFAHELPDMEPLGAVGVVK